ncbi:aldehyde dehydrogenase [Betaproteobacteria bacterium]|nr:aldehyde dehydrogenase [Betaproteobacteria bacterium]GHU01698.1 aldehyde dehydrogenase [Betaproteobacteria bacterium]GHU08476.1 aldehyde dehydrogenase [Betaproteobacteria bacterium]GHU16011.1 aldehyde dehydrogenase [Betaproteobacteria bacterium]
MFDSQTILTATGIAPVQAGAYIPHTGWSSTAGPNFDAVCPADGKLNARIAGATAADFDAIIQAAVAAQEKWRMVPAPQRGELVRRIGELIKQNIDALAGVVALDTGKSMMESRAELKECIDMATLAAGQSRMLYGYTQQSQRARHRMYDQWLPLGVVAVISAYNFPAAVWAQNGFLSVIGGNTVIWKPSPKVPLTAIAIQHLVNQAAQEFDCEGVFSLFIPENNEVAELLLTDQRVALVSFTGSSGVGHKVAEIVGATLGRRYMLECSGNNGCIVDETADLKQAARAITFGVVGTTGQRCTSTRRVIVHRSVANEFTELLKASFAQIKVGDPREADTVVGPLIDHNAVTDFEHVLAQAKQLGGRVVYGGQRIERPGYYVEPTIVVDVQPQWPCVQHETFVPIVYIMTYDDLEEAIHLHNNVPQGLASGMHSTNLCNIEMFLSAAGSDCGIVRINMGTTGADVGAAFGGEKETGGGRTAGSDAWKGYVRRQSVCVNWSGTSPWDSRIKL